VRGAARLTAIALLAAGISGCYGSTEPASEITFDGATLNAWGDTEGAETLAWFEWSGATYGRTTARRIPAGVRGPFSQAITGLVPDAEYSFRLCGSTQGRQEVCAQRRTFRTRDGDVVNAGISPPGGPAATLNASSGPHGERAKGFLSFPPPLEEHEDVVCVSVRDDEAVIGLRDDVGTGTRLFGLRAGIHQATMDVTTDPSRCAELRVSDLPERDITANTRIHDAP
jgi:hypothetical protein